MTPERASATSLSVGAPLSVSRGTHGGRTAPTLLVAMAASLTILYFSSTDERYVLLPALCAINAGIYLWVTLWDRDGRVPFFDAGVFCGVVTVLYTVIPLLKYYLSGMTFTILSDKRMVQHNPSPEELGTFAWRFVLYLLCFVCAYVLFREKDAAGEGDLEEPDRGARNVMIVLFASLFGFFILIQFLFGIRYATSYADLEESYQIFQGLPLIVQQILHYLQGMLFAFKLGLLVLVVRRYRLRFWRIFLYGWMVVEVLLTVLLMGGRTEMVLTLLAAAFLYHRLIRPIRMMVLLPAGVVFFVGFSLFGIYRSSGMEYLQSGIPDEAPIFSAVDETSMLFGTAYDIYKIKENGGLDVPWQIYASDFLVLVPQQLLPLEKFDPGLWYLDLAGLKGAGIGLMFGVISHGIVGLDWLELAFRGALLGFILALVHRWYSRRKTDYFATLFYLWLCLKVYYTFRASTFYPVVWVFYEFLPAYVLMRYGPRWVSWWLTAVKV